MIDFSMSELEEIYTNGKTIADNFYDKEKINTNNSKYKEITKCLVFLNVMNDLLTSFLIPIKSFEGDLVHNKKYLNLGKQIKEMTYKYNEYIKLLENVCSNKNNIATKDNLVLFHDCYVNFKRNESNITKISQLITTKRKSVTYNNPKNDVCMITILKHLDYLQKNIVKPIIINLEKLETKKQVNKKYSERNE